MLESILAVLHNATTLLFGVYISAAFLGVRMNRHNVFTLLIFPARWESSISLLTWAWAPRVPKNLSSYYPPAAGAVPFPLL